MKTLSLLTATLAVLASSAVAAPIAIVNADFEDTFTNSSKTTPLPLNDGVSARDFQTTTLSGSGQGGVTVFVDGWFNDSGQTNNFSTGIQRNTTSFPANSGQWGYVNNNKGFTQTLAVNLAAGTYVLSMDVGVRSGDNTNTVAGLDGLLKAGATTLSPTSSTSPTPTAGAFSSWTRTFIIDGSNPNIGSVLSINIRSTTSNGQAGIDNVALDFTPVPEPSSLLLLCIGALGFAARRRRV